jgi:isocitrate dehydrogenase
LFHDVFNEIGKEYPDIVQDHWIIDIGSALIAERPEQFDVIVTLNLYGDIISDIAAQIAGSVGLAGSANIGEECAMFEAIHGSAPTIAGQNIANPSGIIQGAVLMLAHIGQSDVAENIQNALLKTIEDGIHTADIYNENVSSKKVGTKEFAEAVVSNLGMRPAKLKAVEFAKDRVLELPKYQRKPKRNKQLIGVDLFIHWSGTDANLLAEMLTPLSSHAVHLKMITNRGIKVYPDGFPETFCTDHWRCRFVPTQENVTLTNEIVVQLLNQAIGAGIDVIKTENLYAFDGKPAFSLGQGQ